MGTKKEDILNYEVDLFIIGDDWKGEFDFFKEYCKVEYLERTEGIATTKIKNELKYKK